MAKETMSPEEKKERRKKQAKYLGIFCIAGFAFLFVNVMFKEYRDSKAEKLKLSSDRNKYYKEMYESGDRTATSEEFFNEMFLTGDNWYDLTEEKSQELTNITTEAKDDLPMGITLYSALQYVEIECECTFEEDMKLYAEFLGKMNEKLWSSGKNQDVSLRLFSRAGDQIVLYYQDGKRYMDYNFMSDETEKKWESVRSTNNLSEFESIDYKEIILDEEKVVEELEEFGTVIPYITDELIKAYNDKKQVKILFKSDKYLGYEYLSEEYKNSLIDGNYYSSISEEITEEGSSEESSSSEKTNKETSTEKPVVGNNADITDTESEETEEAIVTKSLSEVDLNTTEDVYLSPDDYCEYVSYVEENDLNYNSHILVQDEVVDKEAEEAYYDSTSWVCVFGNNRMFSDISYVASNLQTTNISYQMMYYLYQTENTSYDLSAGIEYIIKKFS